MKIIGLLVNISCGLLLAVSAQAHHSFVIYDGNDYITLKGVFTADHFRSGAHALKSSWPYIDMTGVQNSEDAVYVEKFTLTANGKRLNYTMTITDPEILVEPILLNKSWLRIEGIEVEPFDCQSG